jgi:hypothetical protein
MFFFSNIVTLIFFGVVFLKIIKTLSKLIPNFYSPLLLFSYYVFEFFILNVLNIIDIHSNLLYNLDYEIHYNDLILPYAGILLFLGCLFLALFFILKHCFGDSGKFISIDQRVKNIGSSMNPNRLLGLLALFFSLNVVSAFDLIYLIQVLSLSFAFSPIIFGLLFDLANNRSKIVWFSLMTTNLIFHIVQGSRGIAVMPILLFIVGYLIQMNNTKRKIRLFIILILIGYPVLAVFGKISDYRQIFGRGLEVSVENFSYLADFLISGDSYEIIESSAPEGLVRLLNHADMAVISLTPDIIDYRGGDYIFDEIQNAILLNGSSERASSFYSGHYGNSVALKYGYSVNESTSVEFSLLADAYSRAGLLGIIIYYSFFTLILFSLERMTASAIFGNNVIALILLMFILISAINGLYAYTIWEFLKVVIFRGAFIIILLYSFSPKKMLRI